MFNQILDEMYPVLSLTDVINIKDNGNDKANNVEKKNKKKK